MKVLGIDSTRKKAKIFVIDSKKYDESIFFDMSEDIKHSEGLFVYLEKILSESKITFNSIDCYACVVGPGSFTGIRVGMSAIKGFNKVNNKSIISLNMFEVMSLGIEDGLFLINSTSSSCYYSLKKNGVMVETGVIDKKNINNFEKDCCVYMLEDEQQLICDEYNNYRIISDINSKYLKLVLQKMNTMDYGDFVPYYLQLSQAERGLQDGSK